MPVDLFRVAQDNGSHLQQRFEALASDPRHDVARMTAFTELVSQNGRISINMRPSVLSSFLSRGVYLNTYALAEELARLSGRTLTDVLRERLGTFYDKRLAFDSKFENGRRFIFGALNIDGAGSENYGVFCVVLDNSVSACQQLAYLPKDSLGGYVDDHHAVAAAQIEQDASPDSHKHYLAVIKHVHELEKVDYREWTKMVCCGKQYIEAIFIMDIEPIHLEAVRLTHSEHEVFWDLAFSDFGRRLDDAERALAQDFIDICRLLGNHGRSLTLV
jgi:hypothetical protein